MLPFQIKICGITRDEDLLAASASGADAVGLNLVATSPRCVSAERAADLARKAEALRLKTAIVVMNPSVDQLKNWCREIRPTWIQLHGAEGPELLSACGDTPVIKALSWSGRIEERQAAEVWISAGRPGLVAFLVDAYAPGIGGGSGRTADWSALFPRPEPLGKIPLLLAGGLKPDNVGEAIRVTQCVGVDTASGVETSPGIKDSDLIRRFVEAARTGLNAAQKHN